MIIHVPDMSCDHCVNRIKNAVSSIKNVKDVTISLASKEVKIEGSPEFSDIVKAVEDAGYTVKEEDN